MKMLVGPYLVDYASRKVPYRLGPLDSEGIPMFDVARIKRSGPPVYHPTPIIQYALAHYDLALAGDTAAETVFLRCAAWLEQNAVEEPRGRFLTWPVPFPIRTPRTQEKWLSGLTQGQAISVLARSYRRLGSKGTMEVAWGAARGFCFQVENGGLMSRTPTGRLFIEEVAEGPATYILNGCLYGLFGLLEFSDAFGRDLVDVVDETVEGVDEMLPRFDMGYWSRYSLGLRWNIASRSYHGLHIRQLKALGPLVGRATFVDVARTWERYSLSSAHRARQRLTERLHAVGNRLVAMLGCEGLKYRELTRQNGQRKHVLGR